MVKSNLKLWESLSNFSLDNPEASFSFSDRLARENGWTVDYSKRVIDEYKKFIYMSVVSGKSLTPSDEVDQAWHMHLIYSYSYWVEMCKNLLNGFNLHHGPTKGGVVEKKKYNNQYNETLDFYLDEFGHEAPSDIWPDDKTRFSKVNYKRVSMHDNLVINKGRVKKYFVNLLTILFALFTGALFLSSGSAATEESIDLKILAYSVLGAFIIYFIVNGLVRYFRRDRNKNSRKDNSSSGSSSSSNSSTGCTIFTSFFGCSSDSGGSSGCSSSGCGSSGCGGCGGCGG